MADLIDPDLLLLERAGKLPSEVQADLDTLRRAGAIPPKDPLVPQVYGTTTRTEHAPEGWTRKVTRYAREAIPSPRTGTGMVGGAIGGRFGGRPGAALGYAGGTKLYDVGQDVYRYFRGQPPSQQTPMQNVGQTLEDVAVGTIAEVPGAAYEEAAASPYVQAAAKRVGQLPGVRQLVDYLRGRRASRQLLKAGEKRGSIPQKIQAGEAEKAAVGKRFVSEAETRGEPFEDIINAAGDQPVPLTETGQLLAEPVKGRRGLRATERKIVQLALPDDAHERGAIIVKALGGAYPGLTLDKAVEIGQQLWRRKITIPMLQELADARAHSVIEFLVGEGNVTLDEAMAIEQEAHHLGGQAFKGSPNQRFYRRLAGTVRRDYKHWLTTSGVQVGGKSGIDAFEEAAANWADLQETEGAAKTAVIGPGRLRESGTPLRPEKAKTPEQAMRATFDPENPSKLLNIQRSVDPDTYRQMVEAWIGDIYRRATEEVRPGLTRYSQRQFAKLLNKQAESGFLEQVLQPLIDRGELPEEAVETLMGAARPTGVTRAGEAMQFGRVPSLYSALAAMLLKGGPAMYHSGFSRAPSLEEILSTGALGTSVGILQRPVGQGLAAVGRTQPLESETFRRALSEYLAQQAQQSYHTPRP